MTDVVVIARFYYVTIHDIYLSLNELHESDLCLEGKDFGVFERGGSAGLAQTKKPQRRQGISYRETARSRIPKPFVSLAPASIQQGRQKACLASDCGEKGHNGARKAQAGDVTAFAGAAPAARRLTWQPWKGSIIPAWRAEVEAVGFCGVVAAILGVSAQGRAELVLRVEENDKIALVLGSCRTRGLKDAERAQRWAEGVVYSQMDMLKAGGAKTLASGSGACEKPSVSQPAAAEKVLRVVPEHSANGQEEKRAGSEATSRPPAYLVSTKNKKESFGANGEKGSVVAVGGGGEAVLKNGSSTIHDICCIKLFFILLIPWNYEIVNNLGTFLGRFAPRSWTQNQCGLVLSAAGVQSVAR